MKQIALQVPRDVANVIYHDVVADAAPPVVAAVIPKQSWERYTSHGKTLSPCKPQINPSLCNEYHFVLVPDSPVSADFLKHAVADSP